MKVLIINGSPRRSGTVTQVLTLMQQEAERHGVQTRWVQVSDLRVTPCCGCMQCRTLRRCVLPTDDAAQVAEWLAEADAVIIGAPCYWGNMPGALKVLFDRMVYALMDDRCGLSPRPLHRGKRALLVTAGSTPFPWNVLMGQTSGTLRALREVMKWSGFRVVGSWAKGGTKQHPHLAPRDEQQVRRLVHRLWRRFPYL